MSKSRALFAALASLVLSAVAFSAAAAPTRAPAAPAAAAAAPASAPAAASAPAPAETTTAVRTQAARKEEDAPQADATTAELATDGDPQPGAVDGELGAGVQPIEQPQEPAPTHVDARVLADCEFGKPNDLASVPVERVAELEGAFVIDTHPEAVRYAKRLAAGEISG